MELINAFNAPIYQFDIIDSTNRFAKNLCKNNPQNGTIIISNEQSNGRGRLGNTWESCKDKGLYYSIILKIPDKNIKCELLTLYICLGITELLSDYSIECKIKWPNDILINNKKVCGILSEFISNDNGVFIVVGIGVNLYHSLNDFKDELKDKATSISLNTNSTIIKNFFINSLTSYLFDYYNYFLQDNFEKFIDIYKNKSSLLGKEISIYLNGEFICGIVNGFDDNGCLLLDIGNKVIPINSGEVTLKDTYKK